jgi:ABC-type nickel/cobalt efflux system permease component RcnA
MALSCIRSGLQSRRVFILVVLIVTSRTSRFSPDKSEWWWRLFAALLFAFYVNFIPVHLAFETHFDDSVASVADTDLHHDDHDDGDHHHDSDHHTPHRASDHTLTLAAAAKAPSVPALSVFFLPALASVLISEPEPQPPIPIFERIRPPGEPPPDPLQPRAPPLA